MRAVMKSHVVAYVAGALTLGLLHHVYYSFYDDPDKFTAKSTGNRRNLANGHDIDGAYYIPGLQTQTNTANQTPLAVGHEFESRPKPGHELDTVEHLQQEVAKRTFNMNSAVGHESESRPEPGHEPDTTFIIDSETDKLNVNLVWEHLVIVTAFSENHVAEAKGMIGSVQKFMPGKRIVVYDLGITRKTRILVRKFCNVEVRDFNFVNYPAHTKNLHTYAWKVFILREALNEFGVIFWGDSSVRFSGSLRDVLPYAYLHHGYMSHIHSYDPKVKADIKHQYYFTHNAMYTELGINKDAYYKARNAAPHVAANRQLMVNNSVFTTKVLNPLTKCAMRKDCIAPEGAVVNKHRFDASALALLIYKNLRYEWTPENRNTTSDVLDTVCTTDRVTHDAKNVKTC